MKKLTCTLCIIFSFNIVSAQDIINLKTDSIIQAKVIEVGQNLIKFKKFDFLNGPTYSINKSNVLSIQYQNGKEDIFETKNETNRKMYVWKPKIQKQTYPDLKVHQNITIEIIDNRRSSTPKSVIEYSSSALITNLLGILKSMDIENKIKDSTNTKVEITIEADDATFYPGWWHTKTRYFVCILNKKTGLKKEKQIEVMKGFYNIGGYATAKRRLSKAYFEANTQLIDFINKSLDQETR